MENFISGEASSLSLNIVLNLEGYPGCEHQIRDALAETIGKGFFFDKVGIFNEFLTVN